jgi:hypothetical protein
MSARLTPLAHARLAVLSDAEEQATAMLHGTVSKIKSLRRHMAEQPMDFAQGHDPRTDEMAVLESRRSDAQRVAAEIGGLLSHIRGYLQTLPPGAAFKDCKPPRLTLPRGKTAADVAAEIRHKLDELKAQRRKTEWSELPREHREAMLRTYAVEQAQRIRCKILFPEGGSRGPVVSFSDDPALDKNRVDAVALAAWIDPNAFAERLIRELPESKPGALTLKEREEKLAALDSQIDDLERRDVVLMEMDNRIPVRPNAAPAAVLGVTLSNARAVSHERETEAA